MNYLFQEAAKYLEQQLVNKLIAQDKVVTSELANSIKVEIKEETSSWKMIGSNVFYGNVQDKGLPSGVWVPIEALIDWVRDKKINLVGITETSFAYAVQRKIYKKGTPTDGNSSKKRWIGSTLEEEADNLRRMISKAIGLEVQLMVANMIENTKKEFV